MVIQFPEINHDINYADNRHDTRDAHDASHS